ncbi:choline dehydrogenase-like flavoprotein [Microbacterium halimionae]|uniref:Choline dehydrogenase-like flavoprotein n=1 Tax=Microbacterium halimionae TaxID=1526413 RepID=A0A7W3JMQ3_9MICO|nr:GMC oxidoreductase [Microbacterium halimionae]MBA8815702.1 choline dehydrogenase-like flavoprotein [Microbacterium halimionae]NII95748.1 choline dehydrogenase-like flavoprotein [Microbacterium halimionae]
MIETETVDVLIVGSGIMGATAARLIREARPSAGILMVDGGDPIGDTPGLHLHDVADPSLWRAYNERVATGIQGMYTGAKVVRDVVDDVRELTPGMFHSLAFGEEAEAMPASALSWNAGGMGVHWTAATPWPAGEEVFDFGDAEQWNADIDTARRVLGVNSSPLGPTNAGRVVIDVLRKSLAGTAPNGREPQPMPMAVAQRPAGPLPRTGPGTIFPPIAGEPDAAFTLMTGTLALELIVSEDGTRVRGVRVRDVASGAESGLFADAVLVCADTLRTPQLLFASGIRPPALGRYLNEHAFITGRVLMDTERFGLSLADLPLVRQGEFCTDSIWIPQNAPAQPFHGQVMNTTYVDENSNPLAYSVGISLYAPVESRATNRLSFSSTESDLAGMPRIHFEFDYSDTDRALIEQATALLQRLAAEFGTQDIDTELAVLPAGSSLHLTGTVRAGAVDDGTSVCDPDGRVWGFENLYLAGNGVIPTAVVANATLTGTVTAVCAARAICGQITTTISGEVFADDMMGGIK